MKHSFVNRDTFCWNCLNPCSRNDPARINIVAKLTKPIYFTDETIEFYSRLIKDHKAYVKRKEDITYYIDVGCKPENVELAEIFFGSREDRYFYEGKWLIIQL